jgi:hypothetical protein
VPSIRTIMCLTITAGALATSAPAMAADECPSCAAGDTAANPEDYQPVGDVEWIDPPADAPEPPPLSEEERQPVGDVEWIDPPADAPEPPALSEEDRRPANRLRHRVRPRPVWWSLAECTACPSVARLGVATGATGTAVAARRFASPGSRPHRSARILRAFPKRIHIVAFWY